METEGGCVWWERGGECGRLNDVFKFWLMWKQRVSECGEGEGVWEGECAVWEVE